MEQERLSSQVRRGPQAEDGEEQEEPTEGSTLTDSQVQDMINDDRRNGLNCILDRFKVESRHGR